MKDHNHRPQLKILWEHIQEPKAEELLRKAIELILNDPQELSPEGGFDKGTLTGLNKDVPVDNINQIKPTA